ncbi:hypothetical protein A9Q78_00250 [Methylophaga sp. 41_12_T18]|nr:hypothetical protein A9Q78_00250 [Methylophaga sp. 41_12_T18]
MSSQWLTLFALVTSLICLLYLRNTDPKRRRVFRLTKWDSKRYSGLAWLLCFVPGVALLVTAQYPAFIMWFAALSVVGWLVALPKPNTKS